MQAWSSRIALQTFRSARESARALSTSENLEAAEPGKAISLEQLDYYRPRDSSGHGAGSDEQRKAAKTALYRVAVERLESNLNKAHLIGIIQKLYIGSAMAKKLKKHEMVDLIAIERWGLEPPDDVRKSWAKLSKRMNWQSRRREELKTLVPPERPQLAFLDDLRQYYQHMGAQVHLRSTDGHLVYGANNPKEFERLLLLILNDHFAPRPFVALYGKGKTYFNYFPFAHRRALPWSWMEPRFVTRIREVRHDNALPPPLPPTETEVDIEALEIELKEGGTSRQAKKLLELIEKLLPAGQDGWSFCITAGYLCHLPSRGSVEAIRHLPKPTRNVLHAPDNMSPRFQELQPRFMPDVPAARLLSSSLQMQTSHPRQVVYRLTRLTKEGNVNELPPKLIRLKLTVREDDDVWRFEMEEALEIDVFLPESSMDARVSLKRPIAVDAQAPWLSNLVETCSAGDAPVGIESPNTPIDDRAGLWSLENDNLMRLGYREIISPRLKPKSSIVHAYATDGTIRSSRYELTTTSVPSGAYLTSILRQFDHDTNTNSLTSQRDVDLSSPVQ